MLVILLLEPNYVKSFLPRGNMLKQPCFFTYSSDSYTETQLKYQLLSYYQPCLVFAKQIKTPMTTNGRLDLDEDGNPVG
jgi:hypothetical protein